MSKCPRCGKAGLIVDWPFHQLKWQRACTTCVAWVSQVVAQIPFEEKD